MGQELRDDLLQSESPLRLQLQLILTLNQCPVNAFQQPLDNQLLLVVTGVLGSGCLVTAARGHRLESIDQLR